MNIENIAALATQLDLLGFDKAGSALLKRIAFKPASFSLTKKVQKGSDQFVFLLFLEKDKKGDCYCLKYYDATLQKENLPAYTEINGIHLPELESKMLGLDWKAVFDFDSMKEWTSADKTSWDKEQMVEIIVNALQQLETTEEGKSTASSLKLKHWAGLPYQEMVGPIIPIKNKSDVSQRFFFSEGQPGISVDEALRFLQNKWLEKQIQIKKKPAELVQASENENESDASSGSGLLKKKRINGHKAGKKNNVVRI